MSNPSKSRQPRLRASCDGCFLAKVKCSKARPVCGRCLTVGLDCRYSPSSRAGKPKSDHSNSKSAKHGVDLAVLSPGSSAGDPPYSSVPAPGLYKIETGWDSPTSMDSSMSRNSSISSLGMASVESPESQQMDAASNMYGAGMPWTPPQDLPPTPFSDMIGTPAMHIAHGRSHSMDHVLTPNLVTWADSSSQFCFPPQTPATGPADMSADYFPSPSATPNMEPVPPLFHRQFSVSSTGPHGACACFQICLHSLSALHEVPVSPPLDIILRLNSNAVESCAAMLACPRCMGLADKVTLTMLLATVIAKITTCYREACYSLSASGAMQDAMQGSIHKPLNLCVGMVTFGEYTLQGEDSQWLEVQFLAHELEKLQDLYRQFSEACSVLSAGSGEIGNAMVAHIGRNLGSTLEAIGSRTGFGY